MAQQMTPQQINAMARMAIKARAVKMTQNVFGQAFSVNSGNLAASQSQVTVNPRMVGLVKGFWVKAVSTITNGSAVPINITDFGPSNTFSQVQFNDLNNNTRIQTSGWHLNIINSIKARRPFGSSLVRTTGFDSPTNYGSNWIGQISAPTQIPASGAGTVTMWYWVPLAYSDDDYRGAVYMNVVNATAQLLLTFNPAPVVANGADSTLAMYVGSIAGSVASAVMSACTITVYQVYMDQIPQGPQGLLLPIVDLATIYELKNTTFTGIVQNQDFPMQYPNFRDFLSTTPIFVNNPTGGVRGEGGDVNYWALQSANFTNISKVEPALQSLITRNHLQCDLPPGTYYFSSREKPISTQQYGNMELVLNASSITGNAYVLVGYEDFGLVQTLSMAGSLAAS